MCKTVIFWSIVITLISYLLSSLGQPGFEPEPDVNLRLSGIVFAITLTTNSGITPNLDCITVLPLAHIWSEHRDLNHGPQSWKGLRSTVELCPLFSLLEIYMNYFCFAPFQEFAWLPVFASVICRHIVEYPYDPVAND